MARILCMALSVLIAQGRASDSNREPDQPNRIKDFDIVRTARTVAEGEIGTMDYRIFLEHGGIRISYWHDVPLRQNDEDILMWNSTWSFICEIPVGTTAKMEVQKSETWNPIAQDTKKGKLRFYKYSSSLVNYGAIPQTWEDPHVIQEATNLGGDDDPIDVLQLNTRACQQGEVQEVRVLGCLGLIDDGETDWKIIVVDHRDPESEQYKSISDVPGTTLNQLRDFFTNYKTVEGKEPNTFADDGRVYDAHYCINIIMHTHSLWRVLRQGGAHPMPDYSMQSSIVGASKKGARKDAGHTQDEL